MESGASVSLPITIANEKEYQTACQNNFGKLIVILFYAEWHEQSIQLKDIMAEFFKAYLYDAPLCFVDSDSTEALSLNKKFNIECVPSVIYTNSLGELLGINTTGEPANIFEDLESRSKLFKINFELEKVKMFTQIEKIIHDDAFVIFMKGNPASPHCGFMKKLVALLNHYDLVFKHIDILNDAKLLQWTKFYAKWKTIPLIFLNGEFVGGYDVLKEQLDNGSLLKKIPKSCFKTSPEEKLTNVLKESNVMLIIAGSIQFPINELTKNTILLLNQQNVIFNCYDPANDILIQEEFKKKYPEHQLPCLFINGEFVESGENLVQSLNQEKIKFPESNIKINVFQKIKQLIQSYPIFCFIKGTVEQPQCGYTYQILSLLQKSNIEFRTFNILADEEIKEKLKEFSGWKTFPQLFIKGEFIGGVDVVEQMIEAGEWEDLIKSYKINTQ